MAEQPVYYGGQAVVEGVMMRGRRAMVTVVRRPGGSLATSTRFLSPFYTGRLRRTPVFRGAIVLIEAMSLGLNALMYSANVFTEEEEKPVSNATLWPMMGVALLFAVALFFVAPLFLTRLVDRYLQSSLLFNLVEGVIRLAIFVAYLRLVALLPDLRRVFAYHGAEHKTVNAYEHGVPLDVDSVRQFNTAHVRCGTSFLFIVMVIAIVVFSVVGLPSLWLMVLSRVVLIPVIAAISYEVTYFGARHTGNVLVRAVLAPGLWLQSLTTREPDDSQLEVAVAALKKVTEIDRAEQPAA